MPTRLPEPPEQTASQVFDRHRRELDIGASARPYRLQSVALACLAGAGAGAVVGSAELARWAFDLPLWLGPVRAGLVALTAQWDGAMAAIGATELHAVIRSGFKALAGLS